MANSTAARSATGNVREQNEDRYLVREDRGVLLLAVADGVGGSAGGEIAANAAIVELADRFFAERADRTVEDRLGDAIREANTAVLRAAESSGNASAATTLVAAAIREDRIVVANLGDSRAYLVRDGLTRQLTEDHHGDSAHSITRFVGDPRGVQPDIFVDDLRAGDRLLLCSDGLTRHVETAEIASLVGGADPDGATDALVDLALARGGEDNVTVVLHVAGERRVAPAPSRTAVAIGLFVAVAVLAVAAVFLILFSGAPFVPGPATPSPTELPTVSPSPSASPNPSPTPTPAPSVTP